MAITLLSELLGNWQRGGTSSAYSPFLGSIAVDSAGNVYAPDADHSVVHVLDSNLNEIAQRGNATDTPAPTGVALDSSNNLYIVDLNRGTVVIYDSKGYATHVPATIGTSGTTDGYLLEPIGAAVDSKGNVYVLNFPFLVFGAYSVQTVQKFDKNGTFVKAWGPQGSGAGQMYLPVGIAIDKYDHVYITDFLHRRIEKFDSDGNYLGQIGGAGVGSGTFGWPFGIAVDSAGNLYVADATNNLVQVMSPQP